MAADHIELGRRGEDIAARYLTTRGAEVLVRNYRFSRAELDIVARTPAGLHFVEVKTRAYQDLDAAAAAVARRKQRNVMSAASRYMDDHDYDGPFQFDIVVVLLGPAGTSRVQWRRDAFGFYT